LLCGFGIVLGVGTVFGVLLVTGTNAIRCPGVTALAREQRRPARRA